jgi:DNA-nicking Smr family endonuclease
MAKKRHKINQEDLDLFHQAIKGTIPLKADKTHLNASVPRKKRIRKPYEYEKEPLNLNESLTLDPVHGEEFISFKQAGISNKILSNLRKGQYNVEATLDLHGLFVEKAKIVIDDFLQQCLHDNIRVVLIIHGKGRNSEMPILKNKLNHWLRVLPSVLAFCSASPAHGSRGAIYVLLKRNTKEYPHE